MNITDNLLEEIRKISQKALERDEENGWYLYSKEELDNEKADLIANTPVPTDKNDLINMYLACKQNLKGAKDEGKLNEVWTSMLNNVIMKLQLTYPNEPAIRDILNREENDAKKRKEIEEEEEAKKEAEEEEEKKKNKLIIAFGVILIIVTLLVVLLFGN